MLVNSVCRFVLTSFFAISVAFNAAAGSKSCSGAASGPQRLTVVPSSTVANHNRKNFEIRDARFSWIKFLGHLNDGVLEIDASLISPDQTRRSALKGSDLYREMMAHFGPENINVITGAWYGGRNMEDFMAGIEADLSMKEAAKETWSGQMAAEFGFTEVTKADFAKDHLQNRSFISVEFRRPQ